MRVASHRHWLHHPSAFYLWSSVPYVLFVFLKTDTFPHAQTFVLNTARKYLFERTDWGSGWGHLLTVYFLLYQLHFLKEKENGLVRKAQGPKLPPFSVSS